MLSEKTPTSGSNGSRRPGRSFELVEDVGGGENLDDVLHQHQQLRRRQVRQLRGGTAGSLGVVNSLAFVLARLAEEDVAAFRAEVRRPPRDVLFPLAAPCFCRS